MHWPSTALSLIGDNLVFTSKSRIHYNGLALTWRNLWLFKIFTFSKKTILSSIWVLDLSGSFEVKRVKHESLEMACVSLRPQSIVLDLWIYRGQPAAWKNWNAQGIHLDFCLWEHQETIQLVLRRTCVHLDVDQSLVYLAHTVLTFSPRSLLAKGPHTREFLASNDFGSLNCFSFLCRFSCLPL